MNSVINSRYFITGSLLLIGGCIDPYTPTVSHSNSNLLVVDGYLNYTDQSALVKLSRAISLSDQTYPDESNAIVTVESSNGVTYLLTEKEKGQYKSNQMNLNVESLQKYRLHIKTQDGEEYQSDYIELKQSPPIDSITWKASPSLKGITIYANTHDASGKTRYYQWTYSETWEYNAEYYSSYKIVGGVVVPRPTDETFFLCWNTERSSKILVESTMRLSQDVVSDFPLTFIERGSRKVSRRYYIVVQQRALTEEAYSYWQQLQKTTESLGGLFDPLPSQVIGNVHNINNSFEPVLGYFNGGSVQEKAIFIKFYDLPDYLLYYPRECTQDTMKIIDIPRYGSNTAITSSYGTPFTLGYLITSNACIDCRSQGGITTKPDFWP